MTTATFNGSIIAESDNTEVVDGNHYFPRNSINKEFFSESDKTTTCVWKGKANYFDITVDGKTEKNAAWTYNEPKEKAQHIKEYVAFYPVVDIQ